MCGISVVFPSAEGTGGLRKDFAAAVIKLRRASGLTQRQLADRVQVTQGRISQIESGKWDITLSGLMRIADACGHTIEVSYRPMKTDSVRRLKPKR